MGIIIYMGIIIFIYLEGYEVQAVRDVLGGADQHVAVVAGLHGDGATARTNTVRKQDGCVIYRPVATFLLHSASRLYDQQFCPMKIGHISGMTLYPSIITIHCRNWDYQRIGRITGMALYPRAF